MDIITRIGFPIQNLNELREFRECMPLRGTNAAFSGDRTANQSLAGFTPPPSQIWRIKGISLSSNIAQTVFIQVGAAGLSVTPTITNQGYRIDVPANFNDIIEVDIDLYESESITFTSLSGGTSIDFECGLVGYRITNDLCYESEKVILCIGDSISNGTAGVTYGQELYQFFVRNKYFSEQGRTVRIVNKGNGSFTSSNIEFMRATDRLRIPQVDMILYNIGMNDVTQVETFESNFPSIITKFKQVYYNSIPMIILGPNLRRDSAETQLSEIRDYESATVQSIGAKNTWYCDLSTSFPADAEYYAAADNVHPNALGHSLMGSTLWDFIQINNIKI